MRSSVIFERLGRGLRYPIVQAVVMYVGFLATALPARAFGMAEGPILIGAAFLTLFSVANPISLVFVPRFWVNLVLSILAWFGLFLALTGTIESLRHMGDDGMVFLGAFMIFPVALLAAGILRLARRRSAARTPA
jgi:hypothetical protein